MELQEQVARMDERLKTLEDGQQRLETTLREIDTRMEAGLKELNDKFAGRPSWPVTVYITLTTSAVVGLLVALLASLRTT